MKNNIKSPKIEQLNLRGIGKLDYNETNKMNSVMKNIYSSLDNDEFKNSPSKKERIECPGCKKKFRTNTGKLPEHKIGKNGGICSQIKGFSYNLKIISEIKSIIINGFEISKNDRIAFNITDYCYYYYFIFFKELKEYVVKKIYLMDNNKIYLDLGLKNEYGLYWEKDKPFYIPISIITDNFIKL